jgi:streptomycin 6-kinase
MDPRTDRLGPIARTVAAEWGVTLGERFASKHSFIAAVGHDAILKVVRPDISEYDHEPDALALWNGDHAVRLLRHDRARRAVLLERALPGHDLAREPENEAIVTAVEVGRALWRSAPDGSPLRNVIELSRGWLMELSDADPSLLRIAGAILDPIDLRTLCLVHGDFHHHNILRRGSGWAVIDPQPAIGEPEYDVATLLWNPVGTRPTIQRTSRWLSAFAAAGLDKDRMRAWAIVRGITLCFSGRPARPKHAPQLQVALSLLS